MAFNAGSVIAELRLDNKQFISGINSSIAASGGLSSKLGSLASTAAKATAALAGVAAAGAGAIIKNMISTEAQMEQNKIAFTTMLGDAQKAESFMSDLSNFAKKTPFEIMGIQDSAKKLMAYGIESDKVIDTLNTLGNISAGVGLDKMPQLTLAFGQVRSATYLTGAELRQFTEAGVPLLEELAKQSGKTASQVKAEMESGMKVPFEEVESALKSLTGEGGRFANLMIEQSKSLSGIWSNLKDAWTLAMSDIAKKSGIFDLVKGAAMGLMTFIDTHKDTIIDFASRGVGFLVTKLDELRGWVVENRDRFVEFKDKIIDAKDWIDNLRFTIGQMLENEEGLGFLDKRRLAELGVPEWAQEVINKFVEIKRTIDENGGIVETLKQKWNTFLEENPLGFLVQKVIDSFTELKGYIDSNGGFVETIKKEWEEFKETPLGQVVNMAIESFKELMPVFRDELMPAIREAMPQISAFFKLWVQGNQTQTMLVLQTVIGAIALALTGLAKGIKLLMKWIAWIAPKWAYLVDAMLNFKENAKTVMEEVKKRISERFEDIKKKIEEARQKISEFVEKIKETDAYKQLESIIITLIENWNTFKANLDLARQNIQLAIEIFKELGSIIKEWVMDKVDKLKEKINELANVAMGWLNEKIEQVRTKISEVLQPVIDSVKQKFTEWKDAVMGVVNAVIDYFNPHVETAKTKIEETKQKTEEAKTKFEELKEKVREIVDRIKEKFNEYADKVKEKLHEAREQFQPTIDKVTELWNAFKDKFDKIKDKITDVTTPLLNLRNTLAGILSTLRGGTVDSAIASVGGATAPGPGKSRVGSAKIPSFANGVTNFIGGRARVGERGPEEVILPPGSSVIPSAQTEQMDKGRGASIHIENMNVNERSDVHSLASELDMMLRLQSSSM